LGKADDNAGSRIWPVGRGVAQDLQTSEYSPTTTGIPPASTQGAKIIAAANKEWGNGVYNPYLRAGTDVGIRTAAIDGIPEISFEELPENRIRVPEVLTSPHPLIVEAKNHLKKASQGRYGRLTRFWSRSEYISVFPESLDRALRIMNALIKALAKRNYPFSIDEEKHVLVVKILDEQSLSGLRNAHARSVIFRQHRK
jgi:hypothetical protein